MTADQKAKKAKQRETFIEYKNWIVVLFAAVIGIFVLPLLGSYLTGKSNVPQSTVEWIIYIVTSICMGVCCICIFLALHNQGKIIIQDDPEYIEAKRLNRENNAREKKEYVPINPFEWEKKAKRNKGIFQTLGTIAGVLGLGMAFLTWNTAQMISGIISIGLNLMLGLVHMNTVQEMFTTRWLDYELWYKAQLDEKERLEAEEAKRKKLEEEFFKEQTLEEQIKEVIDENQ